VTSPPKPARWPHSRVLPSRRMSRDIDIGALQADTSIGNLQQMGDADATATSALPRAYPIRFLHPTGSLGNSHTRSEPNRRKLTAISTRSRRAGTDWRDDMMASTISSKVGADESSSPAATMPAST
jgi:hypothetical protein